MRQPDDAKLAELFGRFGMKSWRQEIQERGERKEERGEESALRAAQPASRLTPHPSRDYETILTEDQLDAWLEKIGKAELTAFDTETTSLDPVRAQLVGMSFSVEPGRAAYLPLAHRYAGAPEQVGLIPSILHHTSSDIGEQHYNLAGSMQASQRHTQCIADIKAKLRPFQD